MTTLKGKWHYLPSGGEEIRGAPIVYVPNLIQKIIQTLDEHDR